MANTRKHSEKQKALLKFIITLLTIRAATSDTQSKTTEVDGVLQAELGFLCAKGTLNGPVPCNMTVAGHQVKKMTKSKLEQRFGYGLELIYFYDQVSDLQIEDMNSKDSNVTIRYAVQHTKKHLYRAIKRGEEFLGETIYKNSYPRKMFYKQVAVEVPQYHKEPAFTIKRPR